MLHGTRDYLLKLKLEFYIHPLTNLFTHMPKIPKDIKQINMTEYIEWDIDKMIREMKKDLDWKTPEDPKLPLRFDCKIEDSLINHTFKCASGCTVHGIICNNFIYDKINKKEDLEETFESYNKDIEEQTSDVMEKIDSI